MPVAGELQAKWEAWKRLGVLASEMESGTLFTVGSFLRVRTGSVFTCVWNQERFNAGLDTNDDETHDTESGIKVAVKAIEKLIESDRQA
jgi:uridine phosphorylase